MTNNPNPGNGGNAGKEPSAQRDNTKSGEQVQKEDAQKAESAKSGESKSASSSGGAKTFNLRMKVDISGTRNLQPWPKRGEVLEDVPSVEASELVFNGYAEPEDENTKVPEPEFKSIYGDEEAPNVGLKGSGGTVVRTGALPGPA